MNEPTRPDPLSSQRTSKQIKLPCHLSSDLSAMARLLPAPPKRVLSIDEVERLYRPIIDACRHLWPSQEERLRSKNPEPFVLD